MTTRVVLLESAAQAERAVRRIGAERPLWFAANAGAAWALAKRGLAYHRPEEFQSGLAEETDRWWRRQVEWANALDEALGRWIPAMAAPEFRPTRYALNPLKVAWDALIQRSYVLNRLAERLRPAAVVHFGDAPARGFNDELEMERSALGAVVPEWAAERGLPVERWPAVPGDDWWALRTPPRGGALGRLRALLPRALAGKIGVWVRARRARSPRWDDGAAAGRLIYDFRYDLDAGPATFLRERRWNLISLETLLAGVEKNAPRGADRTALDGAWARFEAEPAFWPAGPAGPVRHGFEALMRHFLARSLPALWNFYQSARTALERLRPDGLVFAGPSTLASLGLLMAARGRGVPLIVHQHGTALGETENPFWEYGDRFLGDRMLLYGEGGRAYLDRRGPADRPAAALEVVGSARLERLGRPPSTAEREALRRRLAGPRRDRRLILYVPGVFYNNHFRLNRSTHRDVTLLDLRRRVAALCRSTPGVVFLYKPFISIGEDPSLDMLAETAPGVGVVKDLPLPLVQWAVDGLVHELPSTGMTEGLLTDKPVVVLADRDRDPLTPEGRTLLARRARLAETPDDFVAEVKKMLAGEAPAPSPTNRDFLRRFALDRDDGRAARRAADAIAAAARERP